MARPSARGALCLGRGFLVAGPKLARALSNESKETTNEKRDSSTNAQNLPHRVPIVFAFVLAKSLFVKSTNIVRHSKSPSIRWTIFVIHRLFLRTFLSRCSVMRTKACLSALSKSLSLVTVSSSVCPITDLNLRLNVG